MVSNAHTHSTDCDGKNSLAEMAEAAIQLGLTDLGFSCHSPAPFDPGCLGVADEKVYQEKVRSLAQQLQGRLQISLALEYDLYSPPPIAGYDYLIGSVHYFQPAKGIYCSVDESPEILQQTLVDWYQNDPLKMIADYYRSVVEHISQHQPKIVGHFDLITKFNQRDPWFDESCHYYQQIALVALDAVIDQVKRYDGLVEINTGAIARNWLDRPYPDHFLLQRLQERACPVIITSDSHETGTLLSHFSETKELLKELGFTATVELHQGIFQETPLS